MKQHKQDPCRIIHWHKLRCNGNAVAEGTQLPDFFHSWLIFAEDTNKKYHQQNVSSPEIKPPKFWRFFCREIALPPMHIGEVIEYYSLEVTYLVRKGFSQRKLTCRAEKLMMTAKQIYQGLSDMELIIIAQIQGVCL